MTDPLQPYRQPMVTATGLILGFTLNFATTWVRENDPLASRLAWLIGACVLVGVVLLIWVLFRILDSRYDHTRHESYYGRTLALFVLGICVTFVGVLLDMWTTFLASPLGG